MEFADPNERDKILGPLYATAAKAELPFFGDDRFTSRNALQLLNMTVQQNLQSEDDPVIDLFTTKKPTRSQSPSNISRSGGWLSEDLDRMKVETQGKHREGKLTTSKEISTHRESHDKAHYTTRVDSTSKSKAELLDHVMLRRAIGGYLFDCKLNKDIVEDDMWLRGVWEWIEGQ